MLSTLRSFDKEGDRPLNTIHMSALLTKLPRAKGTKEIKLLVAREVSADVNHQIKMGFLHPNTGNVDLQGLVNVAWGLIQVGLADEQQCRRVLEYLDRHLESCNPADLASGLDCFAAANFRS